MRLRRREEDTAPLSPYADEWVTTHERRLLGDEDAARLAHERRREAGRHRPPFVIDYDTDVVDERPDHIGDPREAALAIRAGRRALLAGQPMPWRVSS